jgi:hypothetical protein
MAVSEDALDLLLVAADEGRPVLDEGLPSETSQRAPKPKKDRNAIHDYRRIDADPNDLPLQRWGVVAPKGREGDRLLEAITPLIRLREEEQRVPATIYRVSAEMDGKQALAWKEDVYWSEDVEDDDRPLYLLMLGDLQQVSLELQHTLAHGVLVGRAHFEGADGEVDLDGYAAYAEKVVRFAREGTQERSPDMQFFVARDGTSATIYGEARLIAPTLEASRLSREKGKLPAADVRELEVETVEALLAAGAGARPSVLLSMSHGLGAPRRGWPSAEEQWRRQGALVLGHDDVLDAERMSGQTFLPGGLWFCFACFGAGTPSVSAYHAWLSELSKEGAYAGKAKSVLASLALAGQRPFVASMPQAALRNPAGPLAVIGHMDLAWTYSFSGVTDLSESRKSRIYRPLEVMVRGSRVGVALDALMLSYRETNDALMADYQRAADARANNQPDPTDPKERGHRWMLRNDLRGYVLLGDPAVRLPLAQHTVHTEPSAPVVGHSPPEVPLHIREEAVHKLRRGDEAPRKIAESVGVSVETLWGWFEAHLKEVPPKPDK